MTHRLLHDLHDLLEHILKPETVSIASSGSGLRAMANGIRSVSDRRRRDFAGQRGRDRGHDCRVEVVGSKAEERQARRKVFIGGYALFIAGHNIQRALLSPVAFCSRSGPGQAPV